MSDTGPASPAGAPVTAQEAAAWFAELVSIPRLLVAVSGGPDSVALLGLLSEWAAAPGRPALAAATVDHGLRPESAAEARHVASLCQQLGVPHATLEWAGPMPRTGLQAQARAARYRLLANEAKRLGGAALVTAHTADDQAETILMRMAHGSGPAGLAGMKRRSERDGLVLLRPLLGVAKARLVATAQARGLAFVSDPGNAEPRFERVRWRRLMPALAAEGLDAARLGVLSRRLSRMDAALDQQAGRLRRELTLPGSPAGASKLAFAPLAGEPDELPLRVLAAAIGEVTAPGPIRLERLETCVEALLAAARENRAITRTLSGCVLSLDRKGVLTIRRETPRRRGVHPAES